MLPAYQNESDRRSHVRYATVGIPAKLWISGSSHSTERAQVHNVSDRGLLISTPVPLAAGTTVRLQFVTNNEATLEIVGRVRWLRHGENCNFFGFLAEEDAIVGGSVLNYIAKLDHHQPLVERRSKTVNTQFPLLVRQSDFERLAFKSPYISFFKALEAIKAEGEIDTVVISTELLYLQKRIRQALPAPRILVADRLENVSALGKTLVILNIDCRRKHEAFSLLDFEECLLKNRGATEPIKTLTAISRVLSSGAQVHFLSLGKVEPSLCAKYLQLCKFESILIQPDLHRITATRRALLQYEFNGGRYVLSEASHQDEINDIQDFAMRLFSTDYDFSKEIDNLFTNHSDFYVVKESATGKLLNFARMTWHMPNHFLPCMLSTKKGTDLHIQLLNPDNISYGEIFAPYINSLSAAKIYKELVKTLLSYGDRGLIDIAFTTHSATDRQTFRFFTNYFGFKDTGLSLKYGTFGGSWKLLYASKSYALEAIQASFLVKRKLTIAG